MLWDVFMKMFAISMCQCVINLIRPSVHRYDTSVLQHVVVAVAEAIAQLQQLVETLGKRR